MKLYSVHGVNDFIVCLGYKGSMINEYFANTFPRTAAAPRGRRAQLEEYQDRSDDARWLMDRVVE